MIFFRAFIFQLLKIRMGKKSKKNRIGVVFSTNPDYDYSHEHDSNDDAETLEPGDQKLRVLIDRK